MTTQLKVLISEFEASCDCQDFQWHKEFEQSEEEFKSRRGRSHDMNIGDIRAVYGTVSIETKTDDKRGSRIHEVILSRGDGASWACKHILKALTTRALMPDFRHKAVCFSDEEVAALEARHDMSLVTTCNSLKVVGWGYDASLQ